MNENEEQEVFVSRHGRRTKLNDVDLTGVNVETEPSEPKPPPNEIKSPKVRLHRPEIRLPKPQMSKKQIAITAAGLLILLLLPLIALELLALQYRAAGENLKKEVTRVGTEIALPAQKKSSSDGIEKSLSALSSKRNDVCRGGLLDNVATLYPRSNDALKACNEASARVSTVIEKLSTLNGMQRYGTSVDNLLKPALAASDSPYAVLPEQVATWQDLSSKLDKVNPPNELKAFHNSLKQVTGDIAAQWTALNNAANAQDADAFREAETKLGSFYESMRELAPTLMGVQDGAQTELTSALSNVR